jgi:hypothetical protein
MKDSPVEANRFMQNHMNYLGFYEDFTKKYNVRNRYKEKARSDIVRTIYDLVRKHQVSLTSYSPEFKNFDVVVSFTTYKGRFLNNEFWKFLKSIV